VDAVICGNDVMAIGMRDAATRVLGRRVPEDLAIVGQDGIAMVAWESHDLTTLALDLHAFIATILRLIELQRSDGNEPSTATLTYTVRWGATC
jgi:DNA-binding LacI/PurR family transcriptional regulator